MQNSSQVTEIRISPQGPRTLETAKRTLDSIGPEQLEIDVLLSAIDFDFLGVANSSPSAIRSYFVGRVAGKGKKVDGFNKGSIVAGSHLTMNKIVANASDIIDLPVDLPVERNVFLPLVMEALRITSRCEPAMERAALVLGTGAFGLAAALMLKERGFPVIVGADDVETWHERLHSLGLESIVDYTNADWPESLNKQNAIGYAIDTTGDPKLFTDILPVVATRGWIILAGPSNGRRLDLDIYPHIHRNGLRVQGLRRLFLESDSRFSKPVPEELKEEAIEVLQGKENLLDILQTPSVTVDKLEEFRNEAGSLVIKWG